MIRKKMTLYGVPWANLPINIVSSFGGSFPAANFGLLSQLQPCTLRVWQ